MDGQTGALVPITGVSGGITISVEVPKELLNTDEAVTRTSWIVRNHEGVVDFLATTYDAQANTLTFITDRFSDYAIVYQDTKRATISAEQTKEGDAMGKVLLIAHAGRVFSYEQLYRNIWNQGWEMRATSWAAISAVCGKNSGRWTMENISVSVVSGRLAIVWNKSNKYR